uniref:Uncharacterized protein n=1 Tax=viral metagenome TaxID=1070528 RepID=A0A6C0IJ73_9ZZZZ
MAPIRYSVEYLDYCTTCETKKVIQCCDKCGDSVCENTECCTIYPQHNREDTVLCKYCVDAVEKKFKEVKEPEPKKHKYVHFQQRT